jgi:phage gpG-like protein
MLTARWDNDAAIAALRKAGKAAANLEPAMRQIGEYYVGEIDERFRNEHDGRGRPWAPLSPAYLRQKQRQRTSIMKILQRSGGMRQGINYDPIGKNAVSIGSDKSYAKYHELGRFKRSFLAPNPENQKEFGAIVVRYLQGNV